MIIGESFLVLAENIPSELVNEYCGGKFPVSVCFPGLILPGRKLFDVIEEPVPHLIVHFWCRHKPELE